MLNSVLISLLLLPYITSNKIPANSRKSFDANTHRRQLKGLKREMHGQLTSPSNGTDILSHPVSLIKCNNQTRCIEPSLQLERKYDVYYCKRVSYGVRFYFVVKEGLLLHPNIRMVESPAEADLVVYLPESAAWHKSECNDPNLASKLVVLDGMPSSMLLNDSNF